MTSWFRDDCSGPERVAAFPGMSPIELGSAPRKTLSKTRIVKKELGLTWNRKVSRFDSWVPAAVPLSRFKSRSIVTFPFATIIFSRVPDCRSCFFSGDCGAEFPELLLRSKRSGRVK